jgi:hypothetical protein
MSSEEFMTFQECVDYLIISRGVSRSKATALVKHAIRSGRIPAYVEDQSGDRLLVPPSRIASEH